MIEELAYGVAGAGTLMLSLLFLRIREANEQISLKKYRSKNESTADLLNYAASVDPGVVVMKNGGFLASWLYRGEDNASAPDERRNQISAFLNQALVGLGNGWMLHVDAMRHGASSYLDGVSAFPDPVTEAIDAERRAMFNSRGAMYEGYFVISLSWLPPRVAQQKLAALVVDDDAAPKNSLDRTLNLIGDFQRRCDEFEAKASHAIHLTRLRPTRAQNEDGSHTVYDYQLTHLHRCVTGVAQRIRLPAHPVYLDQLIGGVSFDAGLTPRVGNKLVATVAIEGFPAASEPGILSMLAELPVHYRWSTRFIFMDQHEAVAALEKHRKKWAQKTRGFFDQVFNLGGQLDQDAMRMVLEADEELGDINSGAVASGYYTSVVVLMDEDRDTLDAAAEKVRKAIEALGFVPRIESVNCIEAYLGSLPGHGVENVRRPLIHSMHLANLLPTSTIWTGEERAPCPFYPPRSPALMQCLTSGSAPFRLNLHVRDLGHTLIFGPPGAGKSTLLAMLAAQLRRYPGMTLYAFDKGMSMYALAKAAGGQHYEVAGDSSRLAFAPLQYLSTPQDRGWAMEWIDALLGLNGVQTTPSQRNEISSALERMHESASRTLSDFGRLVQDGEVKEALHQYTLAGAMGHLLDADEDGLSLSQFTVFEIEELMGLGDRFALPVLLYLFRRIERSLKGQPAALILDEAWLMLGHPVFREKIREWLKVLRKANCIVILATQSLTDASSSGILDVLVEATATKIFLPNLYARDSATAELYSRMGLNVRQIEILAESVPKRDYYYVSEKGRRTFQLALGPLALAFVAVSDKEAIAEIRKLEAAHGEGWVNEWLRGKNLPPLQMGRAGNEIKFEEGVF